MNQRPVDDVAVAHDPADIGGAPIDLAGFYAIEVLHRPGERHAVAAGVAHHALGLASRARGVEDVERIGRLHRHARRRLGSRQCLVPVEVAAPHHRGRGLRALQDDHARHLVRGLLDRLVDQRLVFHDARGFDAAGRRQDQLGRAIVDAAGKFLGREAAEHHRVHRAQSRAGEHRHHRFRDHRHIEDDAVALGHALGRDHAGDPRHLVAQLAIGEALLGTGDRRIVDQRRLVGPVVSWSTVHMPVERIVAGIELAAGKPAIEGRVGRVEHLVPALRPIDRRGLLGPEPLGIAQRARMQRPILVPHGHRFLRSFCRLAG